MSENMDQNNSEYGHFSHSDNLTALQSVWPMFLIGFTKHVGKIILVNIFLITKLHQHVGLICTNFLANMLAYFVPTLICIASDQATLN